MEQTETKRSHSAFTAGSSHKELSPEKQTEEKNNLAQEGHKNIENLQCDRLREE